jgi:predicted acyltransferase
MRDAASAALAGPALPTRSSPFDRLRSLDVFRGVTMLFMASEILHLAQVARRFPDSRAAAIAADLLDHRPWVGCAPWDLIQPAFMFMVGVALPFSIASRLARGQSFTRMLGHSVVRALALVALGIFLRSQGRPQTYFTFEDVLTQIGLGYVFLFLLAWTKPAVQWASAAAILVVYWALFAVYPLPAPGFDTSSVGVPADWPHALTGFAAHWNKNTNAAHAFDVWFLNLFPRERPFAFNGGGYLTLNFVPSLATMIFGLLAGGLLRSARTPADKVRRLVAFGVAGVALGTALHAAGVCPVVKRIWTPSWTIFSAGWVTLLLALFYGAIDVGQHRRWTLPFIVVGVNSIAMYALVHVATDYVGQSFLVHAGAVPFDILGESFRPALLGAATLLTFWGILAWMYRRRIFLRI